MTGIRRVNSTWTDVGKQPDPLRRRLAKGGLAIPVVLSTLGSRPVFGEMPYNCTMSGQLSGNTSAHGAPVDCATGNTPSDYLAEGGTILDVAFNSLSSNGSTLVNALESVLPTDPCTATSNTVNAPVVAPEVVPPTKDHRGGRTRKHPAAWPVTPKISIQPVVFHPTDNQPPAKSDRGRDHVGRRNRKDPPVSSPAPEINPPRDPCAAQQETNQAPVVVDAKDSRVPGRRKPATLRHVLESRDGGTVRLAQATIASYFNARRFAPNYPLTPKQVIDMFNAVYVGGTYRVNDSTLWGPNEVQAYFETLFRS